MQIDKNNFEILKKTLNELGTLDFTIDGNSMEPLLINQSKINISKINKIEELKRFDVIVILLNNKLICHYFWKMNQVYLHPEMNTIVTRPLNPISGYDSPISVHNVLGKARSVSIPFKLKLIIGFNFFLKRFK